MYRHHWCVMPKCYCPGGRGYFDPTSTSADDWIPTPDHYPLAKQDGGHLVPENVRLAHKLCNRLDYGREVGHEKQRNKASAEQEQWLKDYPGKRFAAEALWVEMRKAGGFGGYETPKQ